MRHPPADHAANMVPAAAVGAGVLSLPFAFREAGWAGCLLMTLAVAIIEAFTLYVLARYAEVTGSGTYSDLVRCSIPTGGKGPAFVPACPLCCTACMSQQHWCMPGITISNDPACHAAMRLPLSRFARCWGARHRWPCRWCSSSTHTDQVCIFCDCGV